VTKGVREVDLGGRTLTAGDGLEARGSSLYVVRNAVGTVARVVLSRQGLRGRVVSEVSDPSFRFPTTAEVLRGRLLVVNSQFNRRGPGSRRSCPSPSRRSACRSRRSGGRASLATARDEVVVPATSRAAAQSMRRALPTSNDELASRGGHPSVVGARLEDDAVDIRAPSRRLHVHRETPALPHPGAVDRAPSAPAVQPLRVHFAPPGRSRSRSVNRDDRADAYG
jgi:hypothetical protein